MKLILLLLSLSIPTLSFASSKQYDCRNIDVDYNNPFKEGLGVYGAYDTDEDSMMTSIALSNGKFRGLRVGQMSWDSGEAKMVSNKSGHTIYVTSQSFKLMARVYKSQNGVVLYKSNRGKKWKSIATFDCSSAALVYKSEIGHKHVKRISQSKIPKKVMYRLRETDVGFEKADGYFDVFRLYFYAVTSKKGIVGYIGKYWMTYTEDDEVYEAEVKFDRNGVRIADDYSDIFN